MQNQYGKREKEEVAYWRWTGHAMLAWVRKNKQRKAGDATQVTTCASLSPVDPSLSSH